VEPDLSAVVHQLVSEPLLAARCGARAQHMQVTTVAAEVTCAECRRLARKEVGHGG
jgi:hypothetical protein